MILSFCELGKIGLGKNKGKYELLEVKTFDGKIVYDSKNKVLINVAGNGTGFSYNGKEINNKIKLNFVTPTRIKHKGKFVTNLEFYVLIKTILRRISLLMDLYCDTKLELDFNKLIDLAKKVKLVNSNLQWVDWERYSTRQNVRMKLGGFVGEVEYEGNLKLFKELLLLGEQIHIGKNCTFGLGKYKIVTGEQI
jgi:CRISPR-associated endoribonuclease Cas6